MCWVTFWCWPSTCSGRCWLGMLLCLLEAVGRKFRLSHHGESSPEVIVTFVCYFWETCAFFLCLVCWNLVENGAALGFLDLLTSLGNHDEARMPHILVLWLHNNHYSSRLCVFLQCCTIITKCGAEIRITWDSPLEPAEGHNCVTFATFIVLCNYCHCLISFPKEIPFH